MSWQQKMCPLLSAPMLARPKPVVQLVGKEKPEEPEVISCQGPACMWFINIQDPATGKTVGGTCVISLAPQAIGQLTQTVGNVADRMFAQPQGEKI